MEDTLRGMEWICCNLSMWVLILVLMEDTLRDKMNNMTKKAAKGLNPCFNGRYS